MKSDFPIAVIDVGSNSVRLMFTDGFFKEKKIITTRLGESAGGSKNLLPSAIERTVLAISEFKREAEKRGAKKICVFATQAVRGADNKAEFLKAVKEKCGLNVDVLSGEKEAISGLLGATGGNNGGIIDVGGASSEAGVLENGKIVYAASVPVGAVRLYSEFLRNKEKIENYLCKVAAAFKGAPVTDYFAIGGTAGSLAAVDLNLKVYDFEKTDGHFITLERLEDLKDELFSLSPERIFEKYCVDEKRADIIAGGAATLIAIMKTIGLKGVTVSEKDNLEGYLELL